MDSSFDRATNGKEEWLTPPEILDKLGSFDLDPCAPEWHKRPWPTAALHFDVNDDGLGFSWEGRVWCNPPYGPKTGTWLERLAEHGNGIALVFARTETRAFHDHVWDKATALLFIKGRLRFHHADGSRGGTAGAPSVLVAYGENNAQCLENCGIEGKFIRLSEDT